MIGRICPWLPVILVAASGCGGERLATVSGKVTFKDKAVPGGTVLFSSEDKTKTDLATIGADGTYKAERVPYGVVRVAVQPAAKSAASHMPKEFVDKIKAPDDHPQAQIYKQQTNTYVDIPAALRDPETSKITLTVDSSPKTFDIPLGK